MLTVTNATRGWHHQHAFIDSFGSTSFFASFGQTVFGFTCGFSIGTKVRSESWGRLVQFALTTKAKRQNNRGEK
jgi:hypothetical protein